MTTFYLSITLIAVIVIAIIQTASNVFPTVSLWGGWQIVSSLASVVSGLGILIIGYQLVFQAKGHNLVSADFLLKMSDEIKNSRSNYFSSIGILEDLDPHNFKKELKKEILLALRNMHSATFLNSKLLHMVKGGIISFENLHALYFREIIQHPDTRIYALDAWANTDIALEAGFSKSDLLIYAEDTKLLIEGILKCHNRRSNDDFSYQIDRLDNLRLELSKNNA